MTVPRYGVAFASLAILAGGIAARSSTPEPKIDFNRDIRPIIGKCLACHGHDPEAVMAGLRLDVRTVATAPLADGKIAIVPGHPEQSELIRRIMSADPDVLMPPPESNKKLTADEKELLRRWIADGAEYKQHWAFAPLQRPAAPAVKMKAWPRNSIDAFVLQKLEENDLRPSPEADRRTLIRRVSLDLTGLPPTPSEVDAFVRDKSPHAYEKVVDRLLASPRYGERMAMDWMDYARYADSNGYQADWERFQWRWRDWVIKAFNANMPYDQFTVKQIAGDLLPNATMEDRLATGFNRNHRINTEGGVIPEEWRVETVIDRVETTSYTWLGLTAGCARCHDHKYDPISQREFYSLFAYFNNVPETGTGVEAPVNHPPVMQAPSPEQTKRLRALDSELVALRSRESILRRRHETLAAAWKPEASVPRGRLAAYRLPSKAIGEAPSPKVVGDAPSDPDRASGAVFVGEKGSLDLGQIGDFEKNQAFSYSLWINPTQGSGAPISKMDSPNGYRGWDLYLEGGRPALHLIHQWPDNALKVSSRIALPMGKWSFVAVTYDGSTKAKGVHIYIDGTEIPVDVAADKLTGTTRTKVSMKVGRRTGGDVFTGKVANLALFGRALSRDEVAAIGDQGEAEEILARAPAERSQAQRDRLAHLWARLHDPTYAKLDAQRLVAEGKRAELEAAIPTAMVMEEMPTPRDCYVLIRGQYDKHGERVTAGLPKFLPPLPKGAPNNRLGLAEWIVSPDNPLTARVAVNRMWERLFGVGIVETTEDLGTRASFPSHPELLDWLATEFLRLKWDQKAMWKELVMSATYRQDSRITPELLRVDPQNRLLARGPRFRLPGEVIRDEAMFFGGLLTEKIGGPSVRPYQPDGVWDEMNVYGNLRNYRHDVGPNLHRRSLYTIWKRTAAPPNMLLFDVPSRETCRVRRPRTNTPLQALDLMNDVTYVEAARALAIRMLREGGASAASRLRFAFGVVLGRDPSSTELAILRKALARGVSHYRKDPSAAKALLALGDLKNPVGMESTTLAAYTLCASTLLNLDETITKE